MFRFSSIINLVNDAIILDIVEVILFKSFDKLNIVISLNFMVKDSRIR